MFAFDALTIYMKKPDNSIGKMDVSNFDPELSESIDDDNAVTKFAHTLCKIIPNTKYLIAPKTCTAEPYAHAPLSDKGILFVLKKPIALAQIDIFSRATDDCCDYKFNNIYVELFDVQSRSIGTIKLSGFINKENKNRGVIATAKNYNGMNLYDLGMSKVLP
jgi:hypothetical protein